MKKITVMQFRKSPGEFFIDIIRNGWTYILTKAGKPFAKLGPVDDTIVINKDGTFKGETPLTMLKDEEGNVLLRDAKGEY